MKAPGMKSSHAWFLQVVIVLLGLGALGFLLGEPHLEGRNAHATVFEIYFHDPFLAYAYLGAVRFSWRSIGPSGCLGRSGEPAISRPRPCARWVRSGGVRCS